MAEVKGYSCDMCTAMPATRYTLRSRGVPEWVVDLCETCSRPIGQWWEKARAPDAKPKRRKASKTILPLQD